MKKFWLLGLLFIYASLALASGSNVSIQNLNEKYALAKKRANCLFQDSKGFIWFGMIDGLYKFDQYSFTHISSQENIKGIPEADIRAIIEVKPGLLLIGTFDKGLFFYDSQLERSYGIIGDIPTDFSKLNVKCLFYDSSGVAWVGTSNGLYRLKITGKEADKIKVRLLPVDTFNILVNKDFVAFEEAEPGVVWYATMNDIGCYYSETKQIKGRPVYYEAISSFSIIDKKRVLIGCFGTGAKILDTENMTLEPMKIKEIPAKSLVRSVYKDKSSNIWLNISNQGLVLLESGLEGNNEITISNKNTLYSNLNSNVVYQISELKKGEIWICGEDGINLITLKPNHFETFNCNTSKQNPDLKVGIRSIYDSQQGFLWVGTVGGGLKQFDLKTKRFTDIHFLQKESKIDNTIQAIMKDHRGNLWLGTEGEGLIRFYPDKKSGYQKGEFVNFRIYPQSFPEKSLRNDFIMCLLEDKNKNIWIGTWGGLSLIEAAELNKTDYSKVVIKNFLNNPKDSLSISNNTIMSLLEDNEGNIWAGTQGRT